MTNPRAASEIDTLNLFPNHSDTGPETHQEQIYVNYT